tara:strand:+ start:619 stop:1140 length:522 start_codon:yes stop_codon:yes gene_type:complete
MNGLGLGLTNLKQDKVAATISCANPNYTADFSVDADGWAGVVGVQGIQANQDGVDGLDNSIRIRFTDASGPDAPGSITKTLGTTLTATCVYAYTIVYRIPSGNDEVLYMDSITAGGTTTSIDSSEPTNDAWITKTGTFTASSTTTAFTITFNADHDSGAVDMAYINSIVLALN